MDDSPSGSQVSLHQTLNQTNQDWDSSLRPKRLQDFSGQKATVERLEIVVGAARQRGESLKHLLLSGPPGLGKTTLAQILGHEMQRPVRLSSGPVLEKASDLAGLLTSLEVGEILFIDEIHRLPRTVEEYLYSAMEDFVIDIMVENGPNARSVRLNLNPFTLVGATTRTGLLTAPLRTRFALQSRLDYYPVDVLAGIARRNCRILDVKSDEEGFEEMARRARGTPRILNNLLHFVRDYASQRAKGDINGKVAGDALNLLGIDEDGLDPMDARMLRLMAEHYRGGPVGISTLAAAIGEEAHTLEEVHEPYLLQEGYLQRTPQGRMLTDKGWRKTGLPIPPGVLLQGDLPGC